MKIPLAKSKMSFTTGAQLPMLFCDMRGGRLDAAHGALRIHGARRTVVEHASIGRRRSRDRRHKLRNVDGIDHHVGELSRTQYFPRLQFTAVVARLGDQQQYPSPADRAFLQQVDAFDRGIVQAAAAAAGLQLLQSRGKACRGPR